MSASDHLSPQQFTVVTEHMVSGDPAKRVTRRKKFGTFEDALAHAESVHPRVVTDTFPNISEKYNSHKHYHRGVWDQSGDNKYAVILNNRPST